MRKGIKAIALAFTLLAAMFAVAQHSYPTGPNTGKQTTPFSSVQFSATFNGEVTISDAYRNNANTSSSRDFSSVNHGVVQNVLVRFVDHDINVDFSSTDFYANNDSTGGTVNTDVTSRDKWEGHPYTYIFRTFVVDGKTYTKRERYIVVSPREAIFISQTAPEGYSDRDEWLEFEYSLRIK